jgi:cell division transport system permease protein
MFLLGLFIALGTWSLSWSNHVKRELMVQVDFKTSSNPGGAATKAQESKVLNDLRLKNPYVGTAEFVPKAAALKEMKKTNPDLVASLPWNPLPDAIKVTPKHGEDINLLTKSLYPLPDGVQNITTQKKLSRQILRVAHVLEVVFTIATAILLVAATLLIGNTIRLSIFSRRREVEVMKLVGATNWFVRGPFMIEGLLCGLGGALLAVFFLTIGKVVALPAILSNDSISSGDSDVHALAFPITALILMGVGLGLGALGSGLTIRRFLRV